MGSGGRQGANDVAAALPPPAERPSTALICVARASLTFGFACNCAVVRRRGHPSMMLLIDSICRRAGRDDADGSRQCERPPRKSPRRRSNMHASPAVAETRRGPTRPSALERRPCMFERCTQHCGRLLCVCLQAGGSHRAQARATTHAQDTLRRNQTYQSPNRHRALRLNSCIPDSTAQVELSVCRDVVFFVGRSDDAWGTGHFAPLGAPRASRRIGRGE